VTGSSAYMLRWRGRQLGPWTIDQINRKLDDHEIGIGHEIEYQDKWITLEQFFSAIKASSASSEHENLTVSAPVIVGEQHMLPRSDAPRSDPAVKAASQPPIPLAPLPTVSTHKTPRRRLIYGLLAVFLGFSGLHNYYARHWLTGLLQLLLGVATYLLGFGIIATWLWALVEAVAVRKDGTGLEMI